MPRGGTLEPWKTEVGSLYAIAPGFRRCIVPGMSAQPEQETPGRGSLMLRRVAIDTWRAEVGRVVCGEGADLLNDAWGGHDPELAAVAAGGGADQIYAGGNNDTVILNTDNVNSLRLLEKTGFEREGLLRDYLKINGEWRDHLLFSRIGAPKARNGKTSS